MSKTEYKPLTRLVGITPSQTENKTSVCLRYSRKCTFIAIIYSGEFVAKIA